MIPEFMNDWYMQMKKHFANRIIQIIIDEKKPEYEPLIALIIQ